MHLAWFLEPIHIIPFSLSRNNWVLWIGIVEVPKYTDLYSVGNRIVLERDL